MGKTVSSGRCLQAWEATELLERGLACPTPPHLPSLLVDQLQGRTLDTGPTPPASPSQHAKGLSRERLGEEPVPRTWGCVLLSVLLSHLPFSSPVPLGHPLSQDPRKPLNHRAHVTFPNQA